MLIKRNNCFITFPMFSLTVAPTEISSHLLFHLNFESFQKDNFMLFPLIVVEQTAAFGTILQCVRKDGMVVTNEIQYLLL